MSKIVSYNDSSNRSLRVLFSDNEETVWMTMKEIAELFSRDRTVIWKHLDNIYEEGELDPTETSKDIVRQMKGRYENGEVDREIRHYNLDAVLAVGYRVKSPEGSRFRKWVSGIVKDHLVAGISVNYERLHERKMLDLAKIITMAQNTFYRYMDVENASSSIGRIVDAFGKTWKTLSDYDAGSVEFKNETKCSVELYVDELRKDIAVFRENFEKKEGDLGLFGVEREGDGLERIVNTLEQSIFGETLYPTVERKAANLLYFVVKDHPFMDGNKRIGTMLMLRYLERENFPLPEPETASAVTLLVAGSDPSERDVVLAFIASSVSKKDPAGSPEATQEESSGVAIEEDEPDDSFGPH